MASSPGESTSGKEEALGEALRLYIEHRARGSEASDSRLLARHPELRELLEPLLAQGADPDGEVRAGSALGDYRLIERIAGGGMGEVWEAEQLSLQRRVALKLLRGHVFASGKAVERFRREALAGARLQHPCIVAVHAVGEVHGIHFIAQELIESRRTLSTLVREVRELPAIPADHWRKVAALFARIADALDLAHRSGIVHRDLKPSNILLASDGTPKVADFGLALLEGELELSRTGDVSGSPYYMSPEQASASRLEIDGRSDVFSLGATLFEALTLQRAFEGDTVTQVLSKILFHDPRDPREVRSLCPRELAVICMKMLEKVPAHRYQDMREVADELERFLQHQPIRAQAPGLFGRAAKWSRRHPVLAVSGAIVCVSLCTVSALLFETHRARKAAETAAADARKSALAEAASAREAARAATAAQLEARTSARIVDFLVEAFSESTPGRALGRELSAREVLDRGVANIQEGLNDPAEIGPRARLLDSLGLVYSRLGHRKQAEVLLAEARELAERAFGADDERTLEIALEQGRLLSEMQRYVEAAELMREVHGLYVARYGLESSLALRAEGNLGAILSKVDGRPGAEVHLRHALEGLGKLGEWRAPGMFTLSEVLALEGREEESMALLNESYRIYLKQLGPDDPDTLNVVEAFTRHHLGAGRFEEATRLSRELARARTCVLGANHPDALVARGKAAYLESRADIAASTRELEALHAASLLEHGAESPTTAKLAGYLGDLLSISGRDGEAVPMLVAVFGRMAGDPNVAPSDRASRLFALAEAEWRLGRCENALDLIEEVADLGRTGALAPALLDIVLDRASTMNSELDHFAPALELAQERLARLSEKDPRRRSVEDTIRWLEEQLEDG